MWNTKVCLSTLRRKLEKAVKNIIFLTLSVNSVTFSVCWVPLVRFCSEGFWVISENCEYSEHIIFTLPWQTQCFLLSSNTRIECLYLLFCEYYLYVHLSFILKAGSAPPMSDLLCPQHKFGGKKCRICTLSFPLLKFLLVMQLNMLLREEKHLILSILRAKVL